MQRNSLRGGALALALTLSTTASAAAPDMLEMRAGGQPVGRTVLAEPQPQREVEPVSGGATPEQPVQPPEPQPQPQDERPFGPALPPAEASSTVPPPAEASSTVPPPAIVDPVDARETSDAIQRAEWTRDSGATAMVGGGVVTVVGVILILTGFGVTATELKRAGCATNSDCSPDEQKLMHTGRVTLSGLVISSLGAIALLAGIAVYATGRRQVARARAGGGSFDGFALSPSRRGVSLGLRARF